MKRSNLTICELDSSRRSSEEETLANGYVEGLGTERQIQCIDKSSLRIDDNSYGASRQEMSDSSMNSKFTTAVSNHKKSRHRPP